MAAVERVIAIKNVRSMTWTHAPIDVRRVGADCRESCDPHMIGREVAHRIGCAGIAGERKGLAATAAEVELPTRAACARLLHPCRAAEGVESRRVCPDMASDRSRTFQNSRPVIDSAA